MIKTKEVTGEYKLLNRNMEKKKIKGLQKTSVKTE